MSAYNYNVADNGFPTDFEMDDTKYYRALLDTDCENDIFSTPGCVLMNETDIDKRDFLSSPISSTVSSAAPECLEYRMRRSVSAGALNLEVDNISLCSEALNGVTISENNNNANFPNKSTKGCLRSRNNLKNGHNQVGRTRHTSQGDLRNQEFVSMAEAIRKFHQQTPQRFRSKSKLDNGLDFGHSNGSMHITIPQSPALKAKTRVRPVYAVSREEQELNDFKEAQKFCVKANPLNVNILNTPPAISKSKKPVTIPEPFNLTGVAKKTPSKSSLKSFEFHAKPMPKFEEAPKPIIKTPTITIPTTPKVLKRTIVKVTTKEKEPVKPSYKGGPTKPIPFSFDEKISQVKKKKEKLLQEVIEKEKKAREFHAQPLPKLNIRSNQGSNMSLYKSQDRKSVNHQNLDSAEAQFKARPATVLIKPPFIPRKSDKPLTEIVSYPSNSENRSKEREKFYEHLKEREEMIQCARKDMQAEQLRLQKEEIAQLRKMAEHKAEPIRRYKRAKSITPKKITVPVSPKCMYKKNKENVATNNN